MAPARLLFMSAADSSDICRCCSWLVLPGPAGLLLILETSLCPAIAESSTCGLGAVCDLCFSGGTGSDFLRGLGCGEGGTAASGGALGEAEASS